MATQATGWDITRAPHLNSMKKKIGEYDVDAVREELKIWCAIDYKLFHHFFPLGK